MQHEVRKCLKYVEALGSTSENIRVCVCACVRVARVRVFGVSVFAALTPILLLWPCSQIINPEQKCVCYVTGGAQGRS